MTAVNELRSEPLVGIRDCRSNRYRDMLMVIDSCLSK